MLKSILLSGNDFDDFFYKNIQIHVSIEQKEFENHFAAYLKSYKTHHFSMSCWISKKLSNSHTTANLINYTC